MNLNNIFSYKKIIEILLIILPISLLFSNVLAEAILFILILIFLVQINLKYFFNSIKNFIFIFLIIFWILLILNSLINIENNPSYERAIFFIRFPLYILAINFFINKKNINLNKIFNYWRIIFFIIFFDLIFQYFNNVNLFGFEAIQQDGIKRLGGFMNDELKISNLIFHFSSIIFSYFFSKSYNISKKLTYFSLLFLFFSVVLIFLSAERANFITSICFLFIVFIIISFHNIKFYTNIFIIFLITLYILFNLNNNLTKRMVVNIVPNIKLLENHSGKSFLNQDSHYFAHYSAAYQIFQNNKIFGVGLKNFRNFCDNDNFNDKIHPSWQTRKCATHPHSFYFEILSELGITGFLSILIFFSIAFFNFYKVFFKTKDIFLLFNSLIIAMYFLPIPRGSFFNNWNAIIFWTIFSFLYARFKSLENKND